MKTSSHLQRDLFAAEASRRRRHRRATQSGAFVLLALFAVVLGMAIIRAPSTDPSSAGDPPAASLPGPPPPSNPGPVPVPRINDEELLTLLADQGPILIDLGDGRQQLILTRPLD
jgi:hypothetical protein